MHNLQDLDWQGKIKSQNIMPAVPSAIEFKLGTDCRFIDLRMSGGRVTS